jgi:hypothetical protein
MNSRGSRHPRDVVLKGRTWANRTSRTPLHGGPRRRQVPTLNSVCAYYAMFPFEFPLRHLGSHENRGWVLDPFCGRGTSVLAARVLGRPVVGVDSNPVAVAVSASKLCVVSPRAILASCRAILSESATIEVPRGEFWERCYDHSTLREICQLREALMRDCSTSARLALRAILLGALHGQLRKGLPWYLSNQMPRTYATKPSAAVRYWKRHALLPPHVETLPLVRRRAHRYFDGHVNGVNGSVHLGDSRTFDFAGSRRKFRDVVTSPPYLGLGQYRRDQWLRDWFLGGSPKPPSGEDQTFATESAERFVTNLAAVWENVGRVCHDRARLVIRFGAIPSASVSPTNIIRASLDAASQPWRIVAVRNAGPASRGRRQAEHLCSGAGLPIDEVDVFAKLVRN